MRDIEEGEGLWGSQGCS